MVRIKPLSYYDKLHLFDEYKNVDNFKEILKDNDDIDLIKKLLNGFKNPYNIIIQKWFFENRIIRNHMSGVYLK